MQVRVVEEIRDLPFPTEPGWPPGRLALVLHAYISELVGAAEVRLLHRTRYAAEGCRRLYNRADGGDGDDDGVSSSGLVATSASASASANAAAAAAAERRSAGWAQECPKIAAQLRSLGDNNFSANGSGDGGGGGSARARAGMAGLVDRARRLAREKRGYLDRCARLLVLIACSAHFAQVAR